MLIQLNNVKEFREVQKNFKYNNVAWYYLNGIQNGMTLNFYKSIKNFNGVNLPKGH